MTELIEPKHIAPLELTNEDRVFVLTGAGVSAESGLRTFRDSDGLWEQHRVEDVATPEAWARDPELVWRFYSLRREQAAKAEPNAAHHALAQLEQKLGERFYLCTQNVDDLHERAGNKRVHHMHGMLFLSRCEQGSSQNDGLRYHCPCGRDDPQADAKSYPDLASVPRCTDGGRLRPHICWFGEVPFGMNQIIGELSRCTVFITIGSSGSVYPAAGFVRHARGLPHNPKRIYIGPEPPDNAHEFNQILQGPATETLPRLVG